MNTLRKQDSANRAAESAHISKLARSSAKWELFAATQAQSARVLSDETPKGEMAHVLYLATPQVDAFHETDK